MPHLRFESKLLSDQSAHFIPVPAEVVALLGRQKRRPVRVTINDHTYQTTVAVHAGRHFLGVGPEVRKEAGVVAGVALTVELEYEPELRTVDLPSDLQEAVGGDPQILAAFEALSPTFKKEVVAWVSEAKRLQTRQRRLAQALIAMRSRRRGT